MNVGDLFDSPWKILIIAIVVLVLVGSTKLPVFARSLGRSMRILKSEVSKLHDDDEEQGPRAVTEAVPQAQPLPSAQQQIEHLQQQVRDLQQQTAVNGAAVTEAQPTSQPR
jgi:sec-independent protein translocase protein TatA